MQLKCVSRRVAMGAAVLCGALAAAAHGQTTPAVAGSWQPTWSDDFNAGSSDLSGWNYETGNNGGWGNNEYENYTNSSTNAYVSGGSLNIAAVVSGSAGKQSYTSARLTTKGLFDQTYGLIEFRAKLPQAMTSNGTGLWPAVWMMPQNSSYGGWPTSGEMDILESKQSNAVQGSLHSGPDSGNNNTQTNVYQPAGFNASNWNTYDLEWTAPKNGQPGSISWFVNGQLYETQKGGWYDPTTGTYDDNGSDPEAPFDQPFYLIINMAVGGDYVGGAPNLADGTYDMQIDYVHAYSVATPEPTSFAFIGAAAGLLLLGRRRRAVPALCPVRR